METKNNSQSKGNVQSKGGNSDAKGKEPEAKIAPCSTDARYNYRGKEFVDLRTADNVCAEKKAGEKAAHKYAKVHAAATTAGSPCKLGWRYATMVFVAKKSAPEKKEGTAHGIIQKLVKQAGDNGISGMELVPLVRAAAKNNTRTNFGAGQVPPIGWAEGWIDSAVGTIIQELKGKRLELADEPAPAPEAAPEAAKEPEKQAAVA